MAHTRELQHLATDRGELLGNGRIVGNGVLVEPGHLTVYRRSERCGPAAQGVDGLPDLREGADCGLPAMSNRDATNRPAVQIGRIVLGEILYVVQGVLDHAADSAVIARASDEDAVGSADGIDECSRSGI